MRRGKIFLLAFGIFVVAAGAWLFAAPGVRCTVAKAAGGLISVKLSSLKPGTARMFCYDDAGTRLRFILARGDNGKVHAAFDACRQCYMYHRGYRIEHGEIVCRVCGNRYSVDHMSKGKASCVPVHLNSHVSGNEVTVRVSNLRAKRYLF